MIRPVFILSVPRSGSTLLQRLLAAHSAVATTAEPFVLLPMAYGLRGSGARTEYGHQLTVEAIEQFCRNLPGGENDYRAVVRRGVTELYDLASGGSARVFVDKTPAYSLMPDTVLEIFPDAPCIFLWRNPLAIAASISESWYGGRWTFRGHADYLTLGLPRLVAAERVAGDRSLSLRYEDLLADPLTTMERVFAFLDLPVEADVVAGFSDVVLQGDRKDSRGMARYDAISAEPLTRWAQAYRTPVRRMWASRYLDLLGDDVLGRMGYDREDLEAALTDSPTEWGRVPSDAASVLRHAVAVNARARILRQKHSLRWL